MGFAPIWLRQVSPPPASQNHFNHCVYVCVCVCVCVRETERERQRETETETDRQTDRDQTGLQKQYEIRMPERLDDVDLARQELPQVFGRGAALGDDLHGDVGLMALGVGQLDGGVRSAAEILDEPVAVLFQYRMSILIAAAAAAAVPPDRLPNVGHERGKASVRPCRPRDLSLSLTLFTVL